MPFPTDQTLAIDFGTSNSACAVIEAGQVRRVPIEAGAETLPTAVFFPTRAGAMLVGEAAGRALIAGDEGRYMRALKSVLGTALFHEERLVGGRRRSLSGIVTAFLAELKARAERATGRRFTHAVSGRPVHFHGDPERDRRAADDLAACYHAAGFESLRFVLEPEAAALASAGQGAQSKTGLVVDIGGGTSDFTLFRQGRKGVDIVASHGIRLGGTDFDRSLSLAHAMPLLGHGGQLRRAFGSELLPMPRALYVDLATWARIPFLYTAETRRAAAEMLKHAVDRAALDRLTAVLEHELGHELAFAVEAGKIAANSGRAGARINMAMVEPGLGAALTPEALSADLAGAEAALEAAMGETLALAGLGADDLATLVLVGGSSLLAMVARAAERVAPAARLHRAEAFTAVVDGLALAIEREIGTPA